MKITNLLLAAISVFMVLLSGCGTSGNSNSANANIASNANQNKVKRDVKPADFTVTAEELGKEFLKEKDGFWVLDKTKFNELKQKYEGKTIAVTGKISSITRKNRGHSSNYITVYATEGAKDSQRDFFYCTFQDNDAEQMEPLRAGDTVTVQGLSEYISELPRLENCVVAEVK